MTPAIEAARDAFSAKMLADLKTMRAALKRIATQVGNPPDMAPGPHDAENMRTVARDALAQTRLWESKP